MVSVKQKTKNTNAWNWKRRGWQNLYCHPEGEELNFFIFTR